MAFSFFSDPALTTPIDQLSITTLMTADGPAAVPAVVYFGNRDAFRRGIGVAGQPISIAVADVDSGGLTPANVRLALSDAGLATAAAGQALVVGAEVLGGVSGAVAVWVAVTLAGGAGVYDDLSLVISQMMEVSA